MGYSKPLARSRNHSYWIVDIDVLKEGGTVFNKLLNGCNIPVLSHTSYATQRKAILDVLAATGTTWKIDGGINLLDVGNQESARSYFDQLDDYGAFIIRNGELESWLKILEQQVMARLGY
jgi:hypothetical protein